MGHVFSVELPFDFDPSTFDVLDLEPDLDGVDWVEDDPRLPDGSASLYVHKRSTCPVALHLDTEFEVWVPSLSSSADWDAAFGVLERATELFDTVFVTWNDGDLWELPELVAHCDGAWRESQFATDAADLLRRVDTEGTVVVKGPLRNVGIGPLVKADIGSGGCSVEDVLLRTNYVSGPHLAAEAVIEQFEGKPRALTVLGPGLRTLLPRADAVLLDTIDAAQHPVLVPLELLDRVDGLDVTRLDEGHRLVQAVPESAWPAVLRSALAVSV